MDEVRANFNKGLRFQFKFLRTAVSNKDKDYMFYEKNITLGYINAGYWSKIITEREYHDLFHVVRKIYDSGLN